MIHPPTVQGDRVDIARAIGIHMQTHIRSSFTRICLPAAVFRLSTDNPITYKLIGSTGHVRVDCDAYHVAKIYLDHLRNLSCSALPVTCSTYT